MSTTTIDVESGPPGISVQEICDILTEVILPFYKGFPDADDEFNTPKFRKALTGDETFNVLNAIHHLIVCIKTGVSSQEIHDTINKLKEGE